MLVTFASAANEGFHVWNFCFATHSEGKRISNSEISGGAVTKTQVRDGVRSDYCIYHDARETLLKLDESPTEASNVIH